MRILIVVAVVAVLFALLVLVPGADLKSMSLVIVVAAAGVVTMLNPLYGVMLLTFSMLLSPELGVGSAGRRAVVVRVDDLLLVVIFATWMAKTALQKERAFLRITAPAQPIFFYVALLTISTFFGILRGQINWLSAFFYLLKYVEYFFLFFMVCNVVRTRDALKRVLICAAITAVLVTAYGYFTFLGGFSYRVTAPFEAPLGDPEQAEPASVGGYFLLVMGVLLAYFGVAEKKKWAWRALAAVAVIVPPFLLTLSRASWAGFAVSFAVYFVMTHKRRVELLLAAGFGAILLFSFSENIKEAVVGRALYTFTGRGYGVGGELHTVDVAGLGQIQLETSAQQRIGSWNRALFEDLPRHPFIGNGVQGIRFVDSQYALILGEGGIFGFGLFLWMLWRIFRMSRRVYFDATAPPMERALAFGLIIGAAGILTQGITTNSFIIVRIMEPFWLLVALVSHIHAERSRVGAVPAA